MTRPDGLPTAAARAGDLPIAAPEDEPVLERAHAIPALPRSTPAPTFDSSG